MSRNILPLTPTPEAGPGTGVVRAGGGALAPQSYAPYGLAPAPAPPGTSQIQRYLSALRRFRWLIVALTLLGAAIGLIVSRFIDPQYEVQATVWIDNERAVRAADGARGGPVEAGQLLAPAAWQDLFLSGRVQDEVVRRLALYIQPDDAADSALFRGFALAPRFIPGDYELAVGSDGRSWRLVWNDQAVRDQGLVGDSVGRAVGFRWRPEPSLLAAGRSVRFTVMPPREAAAQLTRRLRPSLNNNFLVLTLTGTDPQLAAATLNTWLEEFVTVAAELKRQKLVAYANTQKEALANQKQVLEEAELARQRFKVATITEPTEQTVVAPGVQETQLTVTTDYFQRRLRQREIENSARTLQQLVAQARAGSIGPENIARLNELASTVPTAVPLKNALDEYFRLTAELRAQRQVFTDEAPVVIDLQQRVRNMEQNTIPQMAGAVLTALRAQGSELQRQLATQSAELREIPRRTQEEQRLTRDLEVADALYRRLQEEAKIADLAALSATPDVAVLDSAVAPLRPSKNTTPQILLIAVLGGFGLAVLIALLVDRIDSRFRYPEQAKNELGLEILGAVPVLKAAKRRRQDPDEAAQVVEAFRLVRLNVRHAIETEGPLLLTVSSPQAADGKSLVSSNLALSFAEAGYRTLLIDGDIRRGALHAAFEVPQKPGLADYLLGDAQRKDVLCATSHPNLTVIPCGRRSRQGPELLASAHMSQMLAALRTAYEVIIVDSPPLSAGIDPYALATATEHLVVVLRAGRTNMKLAHNKLAVLDKLPVHVVGTVLNGIEARGAYEYYSYDYQYAADDDESPAPRLGRGARTDVVSTS